MDLVGSQLSKAGMTPSVRILSQVDMNAFAFSNGVVYLHTAILSRMENEAQLATLLGHEFAHVMGRDVLRQHRDLKNKTAFMSGATIALSAAPMVGGIDVGSFANLLFQLSMVSSIYGFSRELESEADRVGLEYMLQAGYDANEAPKLFEIMIAYQDELEEQGIERDSEPFFFSSHPKMKGRIKSYGKLLRDPGQSTAADHSGVRNEETFRDRVEAVSVHQAQLELDAGRYRSAEITVRRALQRNRDNALAWAVLGEALQSQHPANWSAGAIDAYRQSLAGTDENPRAHRALGMAFYKRWSGDSRQADDATNALLHFNRFVELSPDAPDRGYVDAYMREVRPAVPQPQSEEESP
jgi:predicted Zn-dependent protease